MLRKTRIIKINSSIAQVCGFLSQTNVPCSCSSCGCGTDCVDCVDCPNLTILDIEMQVARSGNTDTDGNLIPFVSYPAFTLAGNQVCFLLDNTLKSLQGRYTGIIYVKGNKSGAIEMQIGSGFSICKPYTIDVNGNINDMEPSGL